MVCLRASGAFYWLVTHGEIGGIQCPKVERGEMVSLGEAKPEIFMIC